MGDRSVILICILVGYVGRRAYIVCVSCDASFEIVIVSVDGVTITDYAWVTCVVYCITGDVSIIREDIAAVPVCDYSVKDSCGPSDASA